MVIFVLSSQISRAGSQRQVENTSSSVEMFAVEVVVVGVSVNSMEGYHLGTTSVD